LASAYAFSGYLIFNKFEYEKGHYVALASALGTTGIGIQRYMKTKSLFPSGFLAFIGILSLSGEIYFLNKKLN